MPQVAVPALIAGGAKLAAGYGIAAALQAAAVTAVVSAASYAIQKANQPGGLDNQALTQNVLLSDAPRRLIYGTRRVGGTFVHIGQSDDNKYVHLIIPLATHKVKSISTIWLNDRDLSEYSTTGDRPEATIVWNYAQIGMAGAVSVTVNGTVYNGTAVEIAAALNSAGFIAAGDWGTEEVSDGVFREYANLYITVASNQDVLTITDTGGTVRTNISDEFPVVVRTHLGDDDQLADADIITELTEWTESHRLRGIAYIYVRLRYEFKWFPNGIPTVTALVEGKEDIYDPRTETYGYTTNAALCNADYIASEKWGYGAAYGDEIDTDFLIAAANSCDEQVLLNDGVTYENRYECHGVIDTSRKIKENLELMLSSMGGVAVLSGGQWFIRPAAYVTPTLSLDENDLRGPLSIQTELSRTEACNRVKGTYVSADNDYQQTDFPAVTNATYLAEDSGEINWKDLELNFTTSPAMAQRLAKIVLEQARQGITVTARWSMRAFELIPSDTVLLSLTRMGWTNKPFRVTEWEWIIDDNGALMIDMTLRETAAGVYAWNNGEESTSDWAPNTTLPNPWAVDPVTSLTLTESTYTDDAGKIVPGLTISWPEVTSTPVDHYHVELYLASGGDLVDSRDTENLSCRFLNLAPKLIYMAIVKAVNRLEQKSYGRVGTQAVLGYPVVADSIVNQGDLATKDQVDTPDISDYAVTGTYSDTLASTTELTGGLDNIAGVPVDGVIADGTKVLVTASCSVYFNGPLSSPIKIYLAINGAFWLSEGGVGGITNVCHGQMLGATMTRATLSVAFIAEVYLDGIHTDITADIQSFVTGDSYVDGGAVLSITELKK